MSVRAEHRANVVRTLRAAVRECDQVGDQEAVAVYLRHLNAWNAANERPDSASRPRLEIVR